MSGEVMTREGRGMCNTRSIKGGGAEEIERIQKNGGQLQHMMERKFVTHISPSCSRFSFVALQV